MLLTIDLETGGLDERCSVLTVGIIFSPETADEPPETEHYFLVRPNQENGRSLYCVEPEALQINRIDLIEHDNDPSVLSYRALGTDLYTLLKRYRADSSEPLKVLGKNTYFDLTRIWDQCMSRKTWESFCSYRIIDINSLGHLLQSTGLIPASVGMSLEELAAHYGVWTGQVHNALDDARTTLGIYRAMQATLQDFNR